MSEDCHTDEGMLVTQDEAPGSAGLLDVPNGKSLMVDIYSKM
jgi:hypothetical protein